MQVGARPHLQRKALESTQLRPQLAHVAPVGQLVGVQVERGEAGELRESGGVQRRDAVERQVEVPA